MIGREVDALEAQCKELTALLSELGDADWDRPTRCPPWTVKDVASHLAAIFERLAGPNSVEVEGSPGVDRAGYYRFDPATPSPHVRDRVLQESAGKTGPEVREWTDRSVETALARVREVPADRLVERTNHGKLLFGEFVATRVVEAGVHTMDLGHATLRGERIHPSAIPIVAEVLDGLLGASLPKSIGWDPKTYILTATGRRPLSSIERHTLGPLAAKFPLLV